jgi:hypothetical protein
MTDHSTRFTLRFGGEENEINAATYGVVLVNTVALLEETNKELNTGAHLEIKVKSERKGSFLVDLGIEPAAIAAVAIPLMTKENLLAVKNAGSEIIKTATTVYNWWKKFRSEKPKEIKEQGENVIVIYGDNNTVNFDKSVSNLLFKNKKSRDAIANTFATLNKDENVTDFSILDEKQEPLLLVERQEFNDLSKKVEGLQPKTKKEVITANLIVTRQSFEEGKKSDFLYKGFPLTASITDSSFWKAVDDGDRFGKGDILITELEIEQEFNKAYNAYENRGYIITKVIEHLPRQEQPQLFEN